MRNVIIVLLFVITACSNNKNNSNESSEREDINKVCDQVVDLIVKGQNEQSMQRLKEISVMSYSDLDSMGVKIDRQMLSILPSYGRMLGAEFVREFKANNILVRRNYILKFEKYYLRISFTLYKTPAGWKVTNFDYDDSLIEILY